MYKLAVVGSRDYPRPEIVVGRVRRWVSPSNTTFPHPVVIVSGGGGNVDDAAVAAPALEREDFGWTVEQVPDPIIFYADWKKYGRAAGPIRNKYIVDYSEMLVAFWDGKSSGTKNAIELAEKAGKKVWTYDLEGNYVYPPYRSPK